MDIKQFVAYIREIKDAVNSTQIEIENEISNLLLVIFTCLLSFFDLHI